MLAMVKAVCKQVDGSAIGNGERGQYSFDEKRSYSRSTTPEGRRWRIVVEESVVEVVRSNSAAGSRISGVGEEPTMTSLA